MTEQDAGPACRPSRVRQAGGHRGKAWTVTRTRRRGAGCRAGGPGCNRRPASPSPRPERALAIGRQWRRPSSASSGWPRSVE